MYRVYDLASSVRQNVLAFLADLFYILEVRPAKCIRPPGLMRDRFPVNEGKKKKKNHFRSILPLCCPHSSLSSSSSFIFLLT